MEIKIDVRGIDKIKAFVADLPYGTKRVALAAIVEYMLGDDSHGYRHYPPLGGQAYLKHSPPSYVRTGDTKNSWSAQGGEYQPKIVSSGVYYVQYIPRWKRYGWRDWAQVAIDNMAGAIRAANAAVREYLSRH